MAGNRYGRNQKRRHREERERLQFEIERLEWVASNHHEKKQRAITQLEDLKRSVTEWAADIVAIMGPDSAFCRELAERSVDPDLFDFVVETGGPLRAEKTQQQIRPWDFGEQLSPGIAQIIETFATSAVTEDMGDRKRFMITSSDGRRALMMDARTEHTLRQRGSGVLAEYLLKQLIGPWAKGEGK